MEVDSPLTPEEMQQIRALAKETFHTKDRKPWFWRCALCLEALDFLQEHLSVTRVEAIALFTAWAHENAASVHAQALDKHQAFLREVVDRQQPVIDVMKKELESDKPWEHTE